MSGPKTSRYMLTPEQQRVLREQIEREQRIKEEKVSIKRYSSELRTLCEEFSEAYKQAQELYNRIGQRKTYIDIVTALINQAQNVINTSNNDCQKLEVLQSRRIVLEDFFKKAKKQAVSLRTESIQIKQQLQEDNSNNIDKGFSVSFTEPVDLKPKTKMEEMISLITDRLHLLLSSNLSKELLQEVQSATKKILEIGNIDFLENYKAMTVTPLERRCKQYITEYENNIDHFNKLYTRYHVLCEMINIPTKHFDYSLNTLLELEKEVAIMEKQLVSQAEESYISDSIDRVMEEMGYTLLGDRNVTKRNGKHFRSELFSFREGTAVNITYASDGKITMELGGLDSNDRLPIPDETKKLCEEMQSFCEDFSTIENKLIEKGIILSERISILPSKEEYAQIINVSDFNLKKETFSLNVKNNIRHNKIQNVKRIE